MHDDWGQRYRYCWFSPGVTGSYLFPAGASRWFFTCAGFSTLLAPASLASAAAVGDTSLHVIFVHVHIRQNIPKGCSPLL